MVPKSTLIYHITAIDNLKAILSDKGLYANFVMQTNGLAYTNIAHDSIQDRRFNKRVPVQPFGTLHDYVPFYFAPRSPMLTQFIEEMCKGIMMVKDRYYISYQT